MTKQMTPEQSDYKASLEAEYAFLKAQVERATQRLRDGQGAVSGLLRRQEQVQCELDALKNEAAKSPASRQ